MSQSPTDDAAFWDQYARYDPLWAVLSEDGKERRRWSLSAFMATGEREISVLVHHLESLGLQVGRGRALDFGCGVGRLTQALGRRFDHVLGIDISPRMIDLAGRLNQLTGVDYRVHSSTDFSSIASPPFDLIYSNIVLQHIEPSVTAAYLRGLVRSLSKKGLFIFQLPSHRAPEEVPIVQMPSEAYSAAISIDSELQGVPVDSEVELSVRLANASTLVWDQNRYGSIRLGNHWLSESGEMLIQDDGRVALPPALLPGQECQLNLRVRTPMAEGQFVLELDAVHEGVTWFGDRGSRTARRFVTVGEARPHVAAVESPQVVCDYDPNLILGVLEPLESVPVPSDFPMHAIERADVIRILTDAGGDVIRIEDDDHGRPEWVSYRYFVRKVL